MGADTPARYQCVVLACGDTADTGTWGDSVAAVTMDCPECGSRWDVPPKPDGTMPVTSRCPKSHGGCGKLRKLPRTAAAVPRAAMAAAVTGWDPPSAPRPGRRTTEPCPKCGTPGLLASPRGTVRVCTECKHPVIPAGVAAPYERGTGSTREARSQRERDLEALELARRKGIIRGQLDDISADDRLTPDSRGVVEWFAEQVKAATTGQRLDELADLYAGEKIRRRGWLQGRPAAITAGYAEDGGDDDDEYAEGDDSDPPAAVVLATPASIAVQQHRAQPQPMTWAEALAACGWRMSPVVGGGCQVIEAGRTCGAEVRHCVTGGWACPGHYDVLSRVITKTNRERGIT